MPKLFFEKYGEKPYNPDAVRNPESELKDISASPAVRDLPQAPNTSVPLNPSFSREEARNNNALCLWIITRDKVRYALEMDQEVVPEKLDRICHTNLTGGRDACAGGELWFCDASTLVCNGRSGRYGIRTEEQMKDAASVFARRGYRTGYMPFNPGQGKVSRVAREELLKWI